MTDLRPHPLAVDFPGGTCWRRSDKRRQATKPSAHAELVVLHAIEGRADYVIDGNVVELRSGSLLWAVSGQAHFLLNDRSDFDMWVFLISDQVLDQRHRGLPDMPPLTIEDAGEGLMPRVLTRAGSRELSEIAQAIEAAVSPELRLAGLRWWLARAWAHWQRALQSSARRIHPAVDRAAVLLNDNPALPLKDLADRSGLSASRLAQVFRKELGRTLQDYRTELKLDHVDHLISQGIARDLMSASLSAGFGSYSQFFRAFTAARGLSPRTYYRDLGLGRFAERSGGDIAPPDLTD